MVILHVTYTAKPGEGMARKFVEELEQGPALKVRDEKGNICYDYYFNADDSKVVLLEKWENEDVLAAHMEMPHMAEIRSIKAKYIADQLLEKFIVS